jgi:hypothetical protein
MKNLFKVFGIIAFVAIIGFSMAACDDETHTHEGGAWQTNSTQHWKYCSDCGEEYGRGNHTGFPCSTCGYNIPDYLIGTFGYTTTGFLTITFRENGTFTGTYSISSNNDDVNGTFTVSESIITLSRAYFGSNWKIIDSTTVQDESGDKWRKR